MRKECLQLNNVLLYGEGKQNIVDLSELEKIGESLRRKGAYITGPVLIHKHLAVEDEYRILMPISEKPLNPMPMGKFVETLEYPNCMYSRQILEESDIEQVSAEMERELVDKGVEYRDIFYAIIPIPNGKVIDIYIPIKGE